MKALIIGLVIGFIVNVSSKLFEKEITGLTKKVRKRPFESFVIISLYKDMTEYHFGQKIIPSRTDFSTTSAITVPFHS